ncbi:MAG: hypothetical protein H6908_02835 [Hyphomicrobiales bacterium]|nr:hypothetical protein [Rickettsiales bacterium]MCP5361565.1 hypothetical protein [Hyphomicrobiales bacterium]
MRMFRPCLLLLALVIALSGCRAGPPWAQWMFKGPPPGREYTPLYVEGWQHGCETGASSTVNMWYMFFYGFKQDWSKAQDPVYHKGWRDAFKYCQRYFYQYYRRHVL